MADKDDAKALLEVVQGLPFFFAWYLLLTVMAVVCVVWGDPASSAEWPLPLQAIPWMWTVATALAPFFYGVQRGIGILWGFLRERGRRERPVEKRESGAQPVGQKQKPVRVPRHQIGSLILRGKHILEEEGSRLVEEELQQLKSANAKYHEERRRREREA